LLYTVCKTTHKGTQTDYIVHPQKSAHDQSYSPGAGPFRLRKMSSSTQHSKVCEGAPLCNISELQNLSSDPPTVG